MDLSACTDGQLAGAFAQGGTNAPFEELVRRHWTMVFRTCRRVTGDHQDAEDATQIVFAALLQNAASLAGYRSLGGWLYSTSWHVARHVQRSRATRRRHEASALRSTTIATADGVNEESLRELYRAIEMLPPDYRDVIVLHHLEGLTVEEVAQVVGCSVGTVASRLSRGRAMMRQRLHERELMWSAGMASWVLSAEWTNDEQSVPAVVLPSAAQRAAAARIVIAPAAGCSLSAAGATATKAVAATAAGWTLGKCALAACAAVFAIGVTSAGISYVTETPQPRKQVFAASASASASARDDSAAKADASPAPPRIGPRSAPTIAAVPEPSLLPALALGLLALRRRR